MTIYNNYYVNSPNNIRFKGEEDSGAKFIANPIKTIENMGNTIVDTFTPETENEETKKSNKTAIKVASAVGVLSLFVALMNPKFLGKLSDKMKTWAERAGKKARTNGTFVGDVYRMGEKSLDKTVQILQFSNNFNFFKDGGFKWLCEKSKILKKPHELITIWFDKISKKTVYRKYNKVNAKMDQLNRTLEQYKTRLSSSEQAIFDSKLKQIRDTQLYFAEQNVATRLTKQEKLMSDLTEKTFQKMKDYFNGFKGNEHKVKYADENCKFWAQDVLMSKQKKLESEGADVVKSLLGDGKKQKGAYKELIEILAPHLKDNEKTVINDMVSNTSKKLTKANRSECIEYFDKKRDLVIGSAPTDVLTALGGLAFSGIAIGRADDKQERISRALTMGFPVIAGLGVSMGMTALLYSGVQGMLIGTGSSLLMSKIGSTADKYLNPKPKSVDKDNITKNA